MQKLIYQFHSLSRVLLVIGIVITFNAFLQPISIRVDLTEGNIYTLSRSTKLTLKGLESPVTLKIYFSDPGDLPEQLIRVRQDVFDIVQEYKKAGGKNVIVEKLNPSDNERIEKEASAYDIPELQFNQYGVKELAIKTGYAGMSIVYQDKHETLRIIQGIDSLELDITSAISKMKQEEVPILGIVTGHGETFEDAIRDEFAKQYELKDYELTKKDNINEANGLLIAGPEDNFTDEELYLLDQYVMQGGKLFILIDGVLVDRRLLTTKVNKLNINTILEEYGVKIEPHVILDTISNEKLLFTTGVSTVAVPYPPYPKILKSGIDQKNPITSNLKSIVFTFPSSITVKESKKLSGTVITTLAKTSEESYAIRGRNATVLIPSELEKLSSVIDKEYTLAVLIDGKIESAFLDKDIPNDEEDDKEDGAVDTVDDESDVSQKDEDFISETETGAIFLVANSGFLQPEVVDFSSDNLTFAANALSVLIQENSLTDIQSRGIARRPLRPIDEGRATLVKYGNIGAIIMFSLGIGVLAYIKRKKDSLKAVQELG